LIEERLGIAKTPFPGNMRRDGLPLSEVNSRADGIISATTDRVTEEDEQYVAGLPDVWDALQTLVAWSSDKDNDGWSPRAIEVLWLA
jgi:hypothetical protein